MPRRGRGTKCHYDHICVEREDMCRIALGYFTVLIWAGSMGISYEVTKVRGYKYWKGYLLEITVSPVIGRELKCIPDRT